MEPFLSLYYNIYLEIHHIPTLPVRLLTNAIKIGDENDIKITPWAAMWYIGGKIKGLGCVKDFTVPCQAGRRAPRQVNCPARASPW